MSCMLEWTIFELWGVWSGVFLLWNQCSLCCCSLFATISPHFSLTGDFSFFLSMFSQRHHQLQQCTRQCSAEGLFWSQLVSSLGQSHRPQLQSSHYQHLATHTNAILYFCVFLKECGNSHAYGWGYPEVLGQHTALFMINALKSFTAYSDVPLDTCL